MAKRCHICLEDVVSISNNKKCCKAFICNTCLTQCITNDIDRCPICRDEFEIDIRLEQGHEINDCSSSLLYSIISLSLFMMCLFVASIVIIMVSIHERDYSPYDIILYVLIISSIGVLSCICGCILTLMYCRN